MSQTRLDYLVDDRQSRLRREAADERLARIAGSLPGRPDDHPVAHHHPVVRHAIFTLRAVAHAIQVLRPHGPGLHPR